MKRDMEMVRSILAKAESASPTAVMLHSEFAPDGVDDPTVAEHVRLLVECGMLRGDVTPYTDGSVGVYVYGVSWDGHEYLDAIRSDTVWASVKETARSKGIDLTVDLVKALAVAKARALLGIPPQ